MNGGVALIAEVEKWRIEKRLSTKYCDELIENIDVAINKALQCNPQRKAINIVVVCNAVSCRVLLNDHATPVFKCIFFI